MTNVNLYVDNDNGTYVINNRVMFVVLTLVAFLIIYGAQKMAGKQPRVLESIALRSSARSSGSERSDSACEEAVHLDLVDPLRITKCLSDLWHHHCHGDVNYFPAFLMPSSTLSGVMGI